ncbi:MAG: hypothetical protein A2912_03740 [Candidatus Buchananbacteria bacterium RIFCSPLOWO2_01_FULL_40_23b]|uniref:Uncharacterized protein n=1 Tax=Candidatus Buchananbacteria bacterium RIFCSPLOWO2_01_FULL_40_23b TaxID=1797544 RepID=A0A1G1YQ48_9BACT|nr:MAG: hypothetical protein A2912_03740 [Candidatus Buchananbacteria bacterium RIFCSPLOWO2_01_FULL_40_23b]
MSIETYLIEANAEFLRTSESSLSKVLEMAQVLRYNPISFGKVALISKRDETPYKETEAIVLRMDPRTKNDCVLIKEEYNENDIKKTQHVFYYAKSLKEIEERERK